jgi:hypothetical protein
MDEAAKVLERLERIEALGRGREPTSRLLDELRALVGEAEAWARLEGDERARDAVTRLRAAESGAEPDGVAGAPLPIVSPGRGSGPM